MGKNIYAINRPNFKVKVLRQRVSVDEKNKVVVARIDWQLNAPSVFDEIFAGVGGWKSNLGYVRGLAKGVAMPKEGDEFDVEKGKKIAIAMAESNMYTNASNIVISRMKHLTAITKSLSNMAYDFYDKSIEVCNHNVQYIDRVASGE